MTENPGIDLPAFVACVMSIININLSYFIVIIWRTQLIISESRRNMQQILLKTFKN
jgi:hypothetical protein